MTIFRFVSEQGSPTTPRRIPTPHCPAVLPVCRQRPVRPARSPVCLRTPQLLPNKRRRCKKHGYSSIVNSKQPVPSVLDYEFFRVRDTGSVSSSSSSSSSAGKTKQKKKKKLIKYKT